jgi:hypothetical protein
MAKINWNKTRKFRDFEEKYEPGTELKNGRVVLPRRPDSLAARAAEAEAKWIEERAAAAKKQRQQRRKARYARKARKPPTNAQQRRIDQIRSDLGLPTD